MRLIESNILNSMRMQDGRRIIFFLHTRARTHSAVKSQMSKSFLRDILILSAM